MSSGEGRCDLCGALLADSAREGSCSACGAREAGELGVVELGPSPPAPGDEVGGFVVRRRLDEGGMGHVLLAHDPGLDRKVALKLLHRRLVGDRRAEDRFLREGRALAGVEHANVVKVYAVGSWKSWPFLAMEYLEGTPLSAIVRRGRTTVAHAMKIAEDLAGALAAIHAARIVHRDVKPANVVLRHRDGAACLIDFGLARSLMATTDAHTGVSGTPFYMAPEQIAGKRVDRRADVYAFGVTVFELLTGRVPHEESESGSFYQAALRHDAPLASSLRPDVPRGLDALLSRALARAPELRQPDGRALLDEVRDLRRGIEGGGDRAVTVREPTTAELEPPSDPVEAMPLVGRDNEYAAAARALAHVVEGRGRVVLVEGGPGAGKSRLLRDLERRARADGLIVLRCSGAEAAGAPFAAARAALLAHASAAGADGADAAADLLLAASPEDEPLVPALRRLLGRDPAGADAEPDKSTLVQAALALVRVVAHERPAAYFVDDLHLLDEGSLDLIVALADEAASMPVAVVGAFRPGAVLGREAAFAARRPRLRAAHGRVTIELGPLSEAAVAAMIHSTLHVTEAEACRLAPVLHKRAAGNPLFLVESLRLLEQEGIVKDGEIGRGFRERMSVLELPPRMMELALRRTAGLPADERDTLGVLSIDPDGATADVVASCRDVSRLAALRVLQQLVTARGLVKQDGDRYVIPHVEIREAVYGELIPELRAAYHDRAAQAMTASGESASRPARLGRHLRLAGRRSEAVAPLLAAGRTLLAGYSPADGLDLLEEAIACAGPGGCAIAEVERARALEMLGELDRAKAEFVRLADDPGEAGVAALLQLVAFERNRGHDEAAAAALARALARECSREQRLVLHLQEAELASRAYREDDALRALAQGEALSEGVSQAVVLRLWLAQGAVRCRFDRNVEAHDWLSKSLTLAESSGAQEFAASCMLNLSVVCDDMSDSKESLRWAERAVDRAALIGADRQLVFSLLHLATLLVDSLRLDEAEGVLARLKEGIRRLDSDEARYACHAREGELAIARAQFDRALMTIDAGLAIAADHPRNLAALILLRARALLGLGRADEACESARRARGMFAALRAPADAEESMAIVASALRRAGREGEERAELKALAEPITFVAALERVLDAPDPVERSHRLALAASFAHHPRWRADLDRA